MLYSKQGRNHRHRSSPVFDVERTGAEAKNLLQHRNRSPQLFCVGERPVEFRAAGLRCAGEFDAREVLADKDFQIGKRLVILEFLIEGRLNVLNQPRFHQQRIDFAIRLQVVQVTDLRHQFSRAAIHGGRFGEITPSPAAKVDRLADVNHAPCPSFIRYTPGVVGNCLACSAGDGNLRIGGSPSVRSFRLLDSTRNDPPWVDLKISFSVRSAPSQIVGGDGADFTPQSKYENQCYFSRRKLRICRERSPWRSLNREPRRVA